jgi:putative endonuclease
MIVGLYQILGMVSFVGSDRARIATRSVAGGVRTSIAHQKKSVSDFAYTYVLECGDGKLYMGSTIDLKRRIEEHLRGVVPATQYWLPVRLVYYEACRSEREARKRELQLKTGFGRRDLKSRLGKE